MDDAPVMKPSLLRALVGFISSWAVSVLIAFFFGFLFSLYMLEGHRVDFINAIGHGSADAHDVLLFVAGTITIVAAVVSLVITIFIAAPLYVLSLHKQKTSMRIYVAAGLIIALSAAVVVITIQQLAFPQAVSEVYWLEFVSMLMAGPAYTTTFWALVLRK
ncbi:MAG TPA: hypothetical protein VKB27_16190 [Gammaproteobacteria bacterium]|nr:hypothetical protein [Gammaproteobacteria bacterium]